MHRANGFPQHCALTTYLSSSTLLISMSSISFSKEIYRCESSRGAHRVTRRRRWRQLTWLPNFLFLGHVAADLGPETSSRVTMTLSSVVDSAGIREMSNSATTFFSSQLSFLTSGLLKIELADDEPPSCLELAMCTCIAAISKAITSHVNLEAISPGLNQEDWFLWIDLCQENCINWVVPCISL